MNRRSSLTAIFSGVLSSFKILAPSARLWTALGLVAATQASETRITVHSDQVLGAVSRYLTGACLEDVNHEVYGGIYSQMLFGESFQEPPPLPTLTGFKAFGGRWSVKEGTLRVLGTDGPKLLSEHRAFAEGTVGVEVLFSERAGENAGLVVRVSHPEVGADRFTGYEVSLDARRQTLRLGRHRNNFELIKDVPCEVAVGRWIPLEVKLAGSVIEVRVDGRMLLQQDEWTNALPAGTIGLRVWHREASFRQFWVKTGAQTEKLALAQAEEPTELSGMWRAVRRGTATGHFGVVSDQPFVGVQSQQVSFEAGQGEWGLENQGLNRWGLNLVAGQPYEGCVWARAQKNVSLVAALESRDGSQVYAEQELTLSPGDWQRMAVALTPHGSDKAGRFALKLKQPGSVTLGYALLQPGEWGRFKGLPVRRDVAEGLVNQGITVLRYGGSMVNNSGYKWKKMIGPRERRPPYSGTWYRFSSNGWGIPDFMNFCEAAGFEYIPAFNLGETPQDMADFIEYAQGPADSLWGSKRVADGHPAPYRLKYLELGNEERVDETYAGKFEALAKAIWAKDPALILVVGDFAYERQIQDPLHFEGAASGLTSLAAHKRILQLAGQLGCEVWFDVHVGTEHPMRFKASLAGMFSFADALDQLADGAKHRVVVLEYNAGNHATKRALANALTTQSIERDGRLPMVTSANCLQPDGQNDNGWNQGLLFLNPAQVWLQPPGYVTQMFSRNYLPQLVKCQITGSEGGLDVNAKRSEDGKVLVLQAVNPTPQPVTAQLQLTSFTARKPSALVTALSGPLEGENTAEQPRKIVPKQSVWQHGLERGSASFTFAPHSVTIIRFE